MGLYHISEIEFNVNDYDQKIEQIVQTSRKYNAYLETAPFDTQFLSMQLLKYEARHSNKIEGINTNNVEILAADTPTSRRISNYVAALEYGNRRLRENTNFTVDFILDIHRKLFENILAVDAINANPGNLRTKEVQIANHIPPQRHEVKQYLEEFCEWLNDKKQFEGKNIYVEALIKACIAHAYFEKIHPFADGNGRVGRILFNLIINKYYLTKKPYFYISKGILHDQFEYYTQLARLDKSPNYKCWINFFLGVIQYQLESNIKTILDSLRLFNDVKSYIFTEIDPLKRSIKRDMIKYISSNPIFTFTRIYHFVKKDYREVSDKDFVAIFDEVIEALYITKVPESEYHYQFKKLVDTIVE